VTANAELKMLIAQLQASTQYAQSVSDQLAKRAGTTSGALHDSLEDPVASVFYFLTEANEQLAKISVIVDMLTD